MDLETDHEQATEVRLVIVVPDLGMGQNPPPSQSRLLE